jgi:pimeloyl-ACP methyl ester carboxylesterase
LPTLPALVLVHGGAHAADCWDLTTAELHCLAPELRVLAVDLPGRGSKPADLKSVTITDWVNSVVADVEEAGLGDVVVVGHSMGGLTVPGVVAKLGAARVREMILVAAFIGPQGSSVAEALHGPLKTLAQLGVLVGMPFGMPTVAARLAFWNGMTREQRKFAVSRLHRESPSVIAEPVDRSDLPDEVPRTWILTLRDRSLSQRRQHQYIKELGGVDTVFYVDCCHDVMFSQPKRLAAILIERCRVRGAR